MCIAIKKKGKTYQQGQSVEVETDQGSATVPWASYARSEKMHYWEKQRKASHVVIRAEGFAERQRQTNQIIWQEIPADHVIHAVLAAPRNPEEFLIPQGRDCYIVTRAATTEEIEHFGHDRMPLITSGSL